jgi:hypothetical protein
LVRSVFLNLLEVKKSLLTPGYFEILDVEHWVMGGVCQVSIFNLGP